MMSRGRGRGRGRGKGVSFTGSLEAIGLAPGESAPPPILQPPPLFPVLNRRPLPLDISEVSGYLVAIKQELNIYMSQSLYHLQATSFDSVPVQKYSDKSKVNGGTKGRGGRDGIGWDIDWNFFPKELRLGVKLKNKKKKQTLSLPKMATTGKKRKRGVKDVASNGKGDESAGDSDDELKAVKSRKSRKVTFEEHGDDKGKLEKKLERLEKMEQLSGESEHSGEDTAEEIYEEEEEERTDYNLTYFDNGEEFDGRDDDALEDGPVY